MQGKEGQSWGGRRHLCPSDFCRFAVYLRETTEKEGRFLRLKISESDEGVMVEGNGGAEV